MIIDQEEFDSIVAEAQFLSDQKLKTRNRKISKSFRSKSSGKELDLSDYLRTLLVAYLTRPIRIKTYRNGSGCAPASDRLIRVIFNLEPFRGSVQNGRPLADLIVNEDEALSPLAFRDYLRRATSSVVEITSFQFGCLEVEYSVNSSRTDWKERLLSREDLKNVRRNLSIQKIF